jgi:hypothetical protein
MRSVPKKKNAISPVPVPASPRPYCFVSYSTREPHVRLLLECIQKTLGSEYDVQHTPSVLVSGASQRDQITTLISNCAFGVVCLDGLRPNVLFEYGILHGMRKPVILVKEASAEVDIRGFYQTAPDLKINPVTIDLDSQFSDVKDVNYATWQRFAFSETMKMLWDEYCKKKADIKPYFDIAEPK